jgi:elongation factor P
MISAENVRNGTILKIDGKLYKALKVSFGGAAKAGRIVHLKLKALSDGTHIEKTYHGNDPVEDVMLDKYNMEYIYNDGENYYFMNTTTYEQFPVHKEIVGSFAPYLKENAEIQVEFYNGEPVNIVFPKIMELKVISTGAGIRDTDTTTYKEATLENGIEVLVPQFINEGDVIRVEVETGKYVERV